MRHTNKRPGPPPLYQVLAGRARMVQEFACLIEDLGWPVWRVEAEMRLAHRLWARALEAWDREPWQPRLFYLLN
jgi:hypothetical protein